MLDDCIDMSGLEESVDKACAEIDRLRAARDELLVALKALMANPEEQDAHNAAYAAIAKAEADEQFAREALR